MNKSVIKSKVDTTKTSKRFIKRRLYGRIILYAIAIVVVVFFVVVPAKALMLT